jgi:hypothetical protein
MGQYLDQIPENIQVHIREITKTSGLPYNEESIEKIAESWLEKKRTFEEEIANMNMEEIGHFEKDDTRGALVMTYSGSLVNVGPIVDGSRKSAYASIGLRKDVPEMVSKEGSNLAKDIIIDEPVEFSVGPVKKTSPIFKIIVCKDTLSADEQQEKINVAATTMIDEFVEVNKTYIDA